MADDIVKVQLPLSTSGTAPAQAYIYNREKSIYNREKSVNVFVPVTEDLVAVMRGRTKAFFHFTRNPEGEVVLGAEAEWQDW